MLAAENREASTHMKAMTPATVPLIAAACAAVFAAVCCQASSDLDHYEIVHPGAAGSAGAGGGPGDSTPTQSHGAFSSLGLLPNGHGHSVRLRSGGFEQQLACGKSGRCVSGGFR